MTRAADRLKARRAARFADTPKLPSSIRVGYQDFKIELASREVLVEADGDCHREKQLIRIGEWLRPQVMAEVVIHEVDHAMWPYRWSLVGDVEENFVSALSPVQTQVMRDNPGLYAWLAWCLS